MGEVCGDCSSNVYTEETWPFFRHTILPTDDRSSAPSGLPRLPIDAVSFISREELYPATTYDPLPSLTQRPKNASDCRLLTCFDLSRCKHGFKVYVYPPSDGSSYRISTSYQHILDAINSSRYYTQNADEACIFVSSYDTTDQDRRSENFVVDLERKLHNLPYWNGGINHLIFNIYAGTWPDYSEDLGIDIGYAMLAKASMSKSRFRVGFDISLPLFHPTLPQKVGEPGRLTNINLPSTKKYLLAFKGKRYLTGIGSSSRNHLYHLHNDREIIMLTTCRHGKGWEKYADSRCSIDNELYDRYVHCRCSSCYHPLVSSIFYLHFNLD